MEREFKITYEFGNKRSVLHCDRIKLRAFLISRGLATHWASNIQTEVKIFKDKKTYTITRN